MAKVSTAKTTKWSRLRQVAAEESKETGAALAELAEALGTMADSLTNLREHLDLIEAPKTASVRARIAASRRFGLGFRRIAKEAPEVIADALSEVYHSLDDVAGAMETLAERVGVSLDLTPVETAFGEEGKEEIAGEEPEHPFESESEEEKEPEEEVEEEVVVEEKEEEPKVASKKKADGGAGFITNRDEDAKPEAPEKLDIPEAKGESEVNKAASIREATRRRIAKRHGIEL